MIYYCKDCHDSFAGCKTVCKKHTAAMVKSTDRDKKVMCANDKADIEDYKFRLSLKYRKKNKLGR